MNFFGYWFSDKLVLKRYRAKQLGPEDNHRLYNVVASLRQNANLPMPKVYIIPERSPNAFATGRNPAHAAVAATEGILELLDDDELAGVMAHELAHVKHRDILTGTIAATFAGALAMIAQFARMGARGTRRRSNPIVLLLIMIGAPLAGIIIRSMISRTREYAADSGGADISGRPLALANALNKLQLGVKKYPLVTGIKNVSFLIPALNIKKCDYSSSTTILVPIRKLTDGNAIASETLFRILINCDETEFWNEAGEC